MKKKIAFIMCLIMIITTLFACAEKRPTYVIYASSLASDGGTPTFIDTNVDIKVRSSSEKVFTFSNQTEISKPTEVKKSRSFQINGKNYVAEFDKAYKTDLANGKLSSLGSFSSYDVDDYIRVDFSNKTEKLVFFSDTSRGIRTVEGEISESDAQRYANSAIQSIYGYDALQNYRQTDVLHTNDGTKNVYSVLYSRYVYGYETDDSIQITLNMRGEVVAVNAKKMGLFDGAEENITKDDVDNAVLVLEESLSDGWTISQKRLVVDSNGDYYVNAWLLNSNKPEETKDPHDETAVFSGSMRLYINIK